MAVRPALGPCAGTSVGSIGLKPQQTQECLMCRGSGRVVLETPSDRAWALGAEGTSAESRARVCHVVAGIGHTGTASECPGFPRYLVRRIEELIETRMEGRCDIAELAGSIGYSPSHFFRMFRRSFGVTPHTYVTQRRVAAAQRLLLRTDLRLTEVALMAGFCDQSHLSRTFRRFVGLAPRAFRALCGTSVRTCGNGRDGAISSSSQSRHSPAAMDELGSTREFQCGART
jgi:AraC-like DNA-binding protein